MIIEYEYTDFNDKTGKYEKKKTAVDAPDEIGIFIKESRKKEDASNHKYKYYCPISKDEIEYEGIAYADPTVDFYITSEEEKTEQYTRAKAEAEDRNKRIDYALSRLSDVQRRRLLQVVDGKTLREIADKEGISFQSVYESVEGAKKKFKKYF